MADDNKSPRGFAAMSKEQADRIRSMGGKKSPMKFKKGDSRTKAAGRLGGSRSRRSTTNVD
ncbi:stress-induced protein [Candidatus Saccharibacteria bacterium]|nr:stress-induced protein [Candidatus Saccharibacteria bacterium]